MMNNFNEGLGAMFVIILVSVLIMIAGAGILLGEIRSDVHLCGHTLECYEHIIFDEEKK